MYLHISKSCTIGLLLVIFSHYVNADDPKCKPFSNIKTPDYLRGIEYVIAPINEGETIIFFQLIDTLPMNSIGSLRLQKNLETASDNITINFDEKKAVFLTLDKKPQVLETEGIIANITYYLKWGKEKKLLQLGKVDQATKTGTKITNFKLKDDRFNPSYTLLSVVGTKGKEITWTVWPCKLDDININLDKITSRGNSTGNTTASGTTDNTKTGNATDNTTASGTTDNTKAGNATDNTTSSGTTDNTKAGNATDNTTAGGTTDNTKAGNATDNTTAGGTTDTKPGATADNTTAGGATDTKPGATTSNTTADGATNKTQINGPPAAYHASVGNTSPRSDPAANSGPATLDGPEGASGDSSSAIASGNAATTEDPTETPAEGITTTTSPENLPGDTSTTTGASADDKGGA